MMDTASIVWFRLDLRLTDHPPLQAAIQCGRPVIPIFIHSPEEESPWQPGAASRWWLHHALQALDGVLRAAGSRLIIRRGPTLSALKKLIDETGARAVFWSRRYEPDVIARDGKIEDALRGAGVETATFNAALLHEPWTIQNQSGRPFQVFTPFWRHCLKVTSPAEPLAAPRHLPAPREWPSSVPLDALGLTPRIDWAGGLRATWRPGEMGAHGQLEKFLGGAVMNYSTQRDRPDVEGTSRLSPHLHFGEISPREIWHALRRHAAANEIQESRWRGSSFVTELGWREFAHHVLHHFPRTPEEPLRPAYADFPWRNNKRWLEAWQRGLTGYPMVDAGMRELWTIGWMHNRVRMIAASFLVKDLLMTWREGARWFWDTLVDADLAQNTLNWQWTAGCGADAAPFFRIFNPTAQGAKFDPAGDYVRRWCPELARLPSKWIHAPHQAPAEILEKAGVVLGRSYPRPMVSHAIARDVALEAFSRFKARSA
jgi:deoxyribodipyrimidine photo-lyase